nr:reverse transcriptase domain-containing protein [Tanacetum cinerariifolium]
MLAPGNYVQWKSRIKRYIDTKPNHELIHYFLKNPPYKFTWADKQVPISEGSPVTTTETYMETYKTVSQDIHDQLNAKAEADNSPRINKGVRYENQRIGNVAEARETVDAADSGPIFDSKPVQKVSTDDHYNVFVIKSEHSEQFEYIHDTYPIEQDEHNLIMDPLDMSYDREQIDQNDDDDYLANERELLASLIEKLKCKIDESENRNKFLETSNKVLNEQLKGEIEDFKNKNKSLELSNNRFKEATNKLSETNKLMYNDFKMSQAELERRNDVEYASKVEINCAKAKRDLISYKMESQKSFNKYTQTINDLTQTILEMKKKLFAHQETISILLQQKEAQIKLYKTREDKELDKVIALENKVKSTSLVESDIQTNATMADNRKMAQMLQAPIEGYEDAIVVSPINANNFELKQTLINLVQSNQFTRRQDPHNHLRFFNKVTSTFRHPKVPNTTVKLLLFPFSLEGEARIWLDKEPPRSILTWEDLVSKFINQFFPLSKTTYLRNEITNFLQKSNETFNKAWEHFKDLLRQCPHHGFSELQ